MSSAGGKEFYCSVHFESRDRAGEREKRQQQNLQPQAAAFQCGSRKPFQNPQVGESLCFNAKLDTVYGMVMI